MYAKKGEEAATEEALVETTDVLAEINKMRAAAEAAALGIGKFHNTL